MATKSKKRKSTSAGPRRTGTQAAAASARATASGTAPKPASAANPTSVTTAAPAPATAPETPEKVTPMTAGPKTDAAPSPTAQTSGPAADAVEDDRLKRPDLIEAIANRVSLKRSEAKMVFDVVLDEIGKALDASDEVVVPPLGKLMVKKRMEKPNGAMLTVKLKRAKADPQAGDVAPLAPVDKDS